eukprot:gene9290-12517_t
MIENISIIGHYTFFVKLLLTITLSSIIGKSVSVDDTEYGVDVTYPIHHQFSNDATSHYAKLYKDTMQGCVDKYSARECESVEQARIGMNLDQPKRQHNYTELGFKQMQLPSHIFKPLLDFYENNKDKKKEEKWSRGYTYVNHWVNPSYMINLEDSSLRGGLQLKQFLWDNVKPIIEEWVGKKVEPTSLYGIRVYSDQAILATHVDRLPLVSSCIINVAQDLREPWPVEVYSHAGKAYNFTMKPGDMVLYESHTVLHGRPFPLQGNSYANLFVHYQPIDHDLNNKYDREHPDEISQKTRPIILPKPQDRIGGHEQDNHDQEELNRLMALHKDKTIEELPKEVIGSNQKPSKAEVNDNKPIFPQTKKEKKQNDPIAELVRVAASLGDLEELEKLLDGTKDTAAILKERDENGWQAIHEAVRSGDLETVQYLIDMGADISSTIEGGGGLLWLAKEFFPVSHPVVQFLIEIGAPEDEEEEE